MATAASFAPMLPSTRLFDSKQPTLIGTVGPDSLRAHAAIAGLPVGCAVIPSLLDNSSATQDPYTRTIIEQAGILVAENAMKWSSLRPSASTFRFEEADAFFEFARQHQQLVRGHNLCWHEQLPDWFAAFATTTNARDLLEQHIQTVVGRYTGRVHSWDVVNEPIHPPDGRADGLRNSPWLQLVGTNYVEVAFAAAAKADPAARLTLNEYGIELDTADQTAKRAQFLMLVRRLHARGVPMHAIGIQSHLLAVGPQPGAGLLSMVREVAQLGLEVYITEMDVNTHNLPGGPELQDAAVADVYRSYLHLLLPEPNLRALLTWGISDAHTWLNQSKQSWSVRPDGARQRPLPFDQTEGENRQYAPTPAFFAIRSALDAMDHVRQAHPTTVSSSQPNQSKGLDAPFVAPCSAGQSYKPRP